jgi:DNA-binding transcriptional LysR family regulator
MRTLRAYNPEQPAAKFRPIQSIVDHAVSPRRFFVLLVTIFAGLGLVLAGIAVGTIASFAVARWIAALLFPTEPTDPATFAGMIWFSAPWRLWRDTSRRAGHRGLTQ